LSWGGHDHAWGSPTIVVCFVVSLIAFITLLIVERGRPHAMVPLALFQNVIVGRASLSLLILSISFLGMFMFMPLFVQVVLHVSATLSGLVLLPMMFGTMIGSMSAGRLSVRLRRYKGLMMVGAVVQIVGMCLLLTVNENTNRFVLSAIVGLIGLGLGPQ